MLKFIKGVVDKPLNLVCKRYANQRTVKISYYRLTRSLFLLHFKSCLDKIIRSRRIIVYLM